MRRSDWIEEADATGERRRVYAITGRGRELLAAELSRLRRLLEQAGPRVADGRG
jgi:DNA-binding PadR family transcriptional regulator